MLDKLSYSEYDSGTTKNAASGCWKHPKAADLQTGLHSLGLTLIVAGL